VGLVTGLLGLPLVPVRGVMCLAEQILEQAEEQFYDPARIRARLEQVDEARRSGELSEQECAPALRHIARHEGRHPMRANLRIPARTLRTGMASWSTRRHHSSPCGSPATSGGGSVRTAYTICSCRSAGVARWGGTRKVWTRASSRRPAWRIAARQAWTGMSSSATRRHATPDRRNSITSRITDLAGVRRAAGGPGQPAQGDGRRVRSGSPDPRVCTGGRPQRGRPGCWLGDRCAPLGRAQWTP